MLAHTKSLFASLLRYPKTLVVVLMLIAAAMGWHLYSTKSRNPLSYRFTPGMRLTYKLEYSTAAASNLAALTQEDDEQSKKLAQSIFTDVEGTLTATVIESDASGARIAFQLREPAVNVVSNGELAVPQGETIQSDLQRPFIAEVDPRGRIRAIRFDSDVSALSHAFARALLSNIQIVLPEAASEKWDAREDDPNGAYLARYSKKVTEGKIEMTKARVQYLPKPRKRSLTRFETEPSVYPQGELTARFDSTLGVVRSVEGREAANQAIDGRVIGRNETILKLTLTGHETIPSAEVAVLRKLVGELNAGVALSAPADPAASEALIQKAELGNATLESLLAEVAQLEAAGEAATNDTPLYLKLKALVHLHPEACPKLGAVLAAAKADGPAMQLLSGVLSSVGHAHAQAALRNAIMKRTDDWDALTLLVPALGMVEQPTVQAEEMLRDLAGKSKDVNIRTTAQLALGTMARNLMESSPARSGRIVKDAMKELQAATTPAERRQMLLVLGNVGAAESRDLVSKFLSDEAAEVRAAAVAALRWIEGDAVDGLLARVLTTDADASVRGEAATVFGFRAMCQVSFDAQKQALVKDESPSVRLAAMANLARGARAFPEAVELLAWAASEDASEEVRAEAARLLQGLPK